MGRFRCWTGPLYLPKGAQIQLVRAIFEQGQGVLFPLPLARVVLTGSGMREVASW
ncbi:hypothetical protein [Pajaroellobacter abortibovis]|uniref:hypothetical protein n=1 Tax=Pajaroellobacter abortibovis TaxID=1882918 RepID=UPI0012EB5D4A|nr:hypothetical protein [Pajaroellobacter abortibovis]